jgi:hypothetical protein
MCNTCKEYFLSAHDAKKGALFYEESSRKFDLIPAKYYLRPSAERGKLGGYHRGGNGSMEPFTDVRPQFSLLIEQHLGEG